VAGVQPVQVHPRVEAQVRRRQAAHASPEGGQGRGVRALQRLLLVTLAKYEPVSINTVL